MLCQKFAVTIIIKIIEQKATKKMLIGTRTEAGIPIILSEVILNFTMLCHEIVELDDIYFHSQ